MSKLVLSVVLVGSAVLLAACNGQPPPGHAALDSGITSSNGGGQRAVGDLPEVDVTNGKPSVGLMPASPRVPVY